MIKMVSGRYKGCIKMCIVWLYIILYTIVCITNVLLEHFFLYSSKLEKDFKSVVA